MDNAKKITPPDCLCAMCQEYSPLLDLMRKTGNLRWLTVSPPADDKDPELSYKDWMQRLKPLVNIASSLILVAEISSQLRLHFHILFCSKDKVKEYKYVNGWRHNAMIRVYNGEPREGLHYMFKDLEETQGYLPGIQLVLTRSDMQIYAKRMKHSVTVPQGILEYFDL